MPRDLSNSNDDEDGNSYVGEAELMKSRRKPRHARSQAEGK